MEFGLKLDQIQSVAQHLRLGLARLVAETAREHLQAFPQPIEIPVDIQGSFGVGLEKGFDRGFQRVLEALAARCGLMHETDGLEEPSQRKGLVVKVLVQTVCPSGAGHVG